MTETGRFKDAHWIGLGEKDVTIVGAGGIGSWLSLFLARIGCNLFVYDMDALDASNFAGQLYPYRAVGSRKTTALQNLIADFAANRVVQGDKFIDTSTITPVLISALDNMETRKLMFNKWKKAYIDQEIKEVFIAFVDGRMAAESGTIYIVYDKRTAEEYEKTLFDDASVSDGPCTFKATSHCGALIASLMTSLLTNCYSNYIEGALVRDVPFETCFDLPLLEFRVNEKISQY